MSDFAFEASKTALVLIDLQNDFLHPQGAYSRSGTSTPAIVALPARLHPVATAMRAAGGFVVSTHFTLVPGKDGIPLISDHLRRLRPFLTMGDFQPGAFGHQLVDALKPADFTVEKVAFSAFYESRLEFVLRMADIETLIFAGIVTNGGIARFPLRRVERRLCSFFRRGSSSRSRVDQHFGNAADLRPADRFADPQMSLFPAADKRFDVAIPVAIVGAGACGLTAALAAHDVGAEVVVFERDALPRGSTALSSGFIPAAGTRYQRARGIADSPALLLSDIQHKSHGQSDPVIADIVSHESGPTIEWLADRHGLEFVLVDGFLYPGHSVLRMHAHPRRTGEALMGALLDAANRVGIDIITEAHVVDLYADVDGRVRGLACLRPGGGREEVGCDTLVLACNGYGGNVEMLRRHIPEMADALYFGHAGNQGDAVLWGEALGGAALDMSAYQGHGSVATPHNILITWALMMEGGFQINAEGKRFSNEYLGYSEQAVAVLAQPGGVAWCVYDARIHALGRDFEDYRNAEAAGAIRCADDVRGLAAIANVPGAVLSDTFAAVARYHRGDADPFGRDFSGKPTIAPPYYTVRVTGALFHTQGGLAIDRTARVLRRDCTPLPNLFAGGGAARGASGAAVWGYLSGNGLLTAVTLGGIAGASAARTSRSQISPV